MMLRFLTALLALPLLIVAPLSAAEEERKYCHDLDGTSVCIAEGSYLADTCAAIERYASHYSLPPDYFARLIWQESRFDPAAISPAGAQGIAQFMPGTAALRALRNPFDPAEALERSAEYLRALELKYGNLGLAAAAYNGGEGKVSRYLAGTGGLAGETRAYVSIITGRPVDGWTGGTVAEADYTLSKEKPFAEACIDMASAAPMPEFGPEPGAWQPWGVLIAQNFSQDIARSAFTRAQSRHSDVFADHPLLLVTVRNLSMGTRLRYSAQIGFPTRNEAQSFCNKLLDAGGSCIVQRNGS
ncbi:lytic transglycosylase domain-containing protein [Devosia rhizoryzae]|uniref:Lytic transglycosylase domain-containing protein n=1 Tax=Devosia rhizoryzae TaxID=2774137 RepID=A0ABX7C617_9HYPH|nr:lytic transglycosylase domain-containing protein [Devosia rhizoryzae]QQR39708.1 lytic transglycosylase domain-containing protein [Devosia rhizoryzae]